MGLAASQARLLSITSRLSDNELRSQTITNAKMSLATKTTDASSQYMNALNATQLMFSTYDASGNKMTQRLSASSLATYGELKNQYGVINNAGQIMVSELDAANYLASATLADFLAKYGVAEATKTDKPNPEYIDKATTIWGPDWEIWDNGGTGAVGGLNGREPQQPDFTKVVITKDPNSELYQKFRDASAGCYNQAMGSRPVCYLHVLAHLLDLNEELSGFPKSYTTINGDSISIGKDKITGSNIFFNGKTGNMVPVSQKVCEDGVMAAENEADMNELLSMVNNPSTDPNALRNKKLLSNYYIDAAGNAQLKTLKQKVIDLYYAVENYGSLGIDYDTTLKDSMRSFQEDMTLLDMIYNVEPDVPAYEKAHDEWEAEMEKQINELHQIEKIMTVIDIEYTDKDAAQWYINLWHRMNGPSDYKVELDGFDNGARADEKTKAALGEQETGDTSPANGLTPGGQLLWTVLEDGLYNSADWLQAALENGTVTLERVQFTEPTEEGTGLEDVTWTSILYTNASDISEEQNEAAITKAEIQYQATVKDIEAKDKQYDNVLKRLDTEHSALQTEYDSVKSIIDKQIERHLKMYS
ncbi:MAG: hypothetical protein KIC80_06125 [Brachyspira sp.]|nr:hypothetical protein [Brachyspira sp.]